MKIFWILAFAMTAIFAPGATDAQENELENCRKIGFEGLFKRCLGETLQPLIQ